MARRRSASRTCKLKARLPTAANSATSTTPHAMLRARVDRPGAVIRLPRVRERPRRARPPWRRQARPSQGRASRQPRGPARSRPATAASPASGRAPVLSTRFTDVAGASGRSPRTCPGASRTMSAGGPIFSLSRAMPTTCTGSLSIPISMLRRRRSSSSCVLIRRSRPRSYATSMPFMRTPTCAIAPAVTSASTNAPTPMPRRPPISARTAAGIAKSGRPARPTASIPIRSSPPRAAWRSATGGCAPVPRRPRRRRAS